MTRLLKSIRSRIYGRILHIVLSDLYYEFEDLQLNQLRLYRTAGSSQEKMFHLGCVSAYKKCCNIIDKRFNI